MSMEEFILVNESKPFLWINSMYESYPNATNIICYEWELTQQDNIFQVDEWKDWINLHNVSKQISSVEYFRSGWISMDEWIKFLKS
jgi:hypothetical protein